MARNSTSCPASALAESDIPGLFYDSSTALCGVPFPSESPWQTLSQCCSGPVMAYNSCLQYCQPISSSTFGSCAMMAANSTSRPSIATCNKAATSDGHGLGVGNGSWALWAVLAALLVRSL
ncbi:hypothetical protein B0A48_08569 [Cryoendolithus antarcticus]|uniref:Uncharacterized protein n=1 Tax=Cryoendolithus antarcticus TaxID=1507870 RepID=A0A1V8T695_9PEZI|nr:hypothetical protein B0A48_08569 [Cryoendolithus antarcticus]